MAPGQSEPPAETALPVTSPPRTITPSAGTGNDQPISPAQNLTPSSPAPASTNQKATQPEITGRVTDSNKQPVSEAIVLIVQGTSEYPERTYLTDALGQYTIGVPPGRYTVMVNAEGFKIVQKEVEVLADKQATLDFELEKE